MKTKVLLTGATGFVGRHFLQEIVRAGYPVRCLVRSEMHSFIDSVEYYQGDLLCFEDCKEALEGIEIVYHIAGLGLSRMQENSIFNVESTRTLFKACEAEGRLIKFIFLSSFKAGLPDRRYTLSPWFEAYSPDRYGKSKWESEQIFKESSHPNVKVAVIRSPMIYGPGDKNLIAFFWLAQKGVMPVITGVMPVSDMVYVTDLAQLLIELLGTPFVEETEIITIANPNPITINDLLTDIADVSESVKWRPHIPKKVFFYILMFISKSLNLISRTSILPVERVYDLCHYSWTCTAKDAEVNRSIECKTSLYKGIYYTYQHYINLKNNN